MRAEKLLFALLGLGIFLRVLAVAMGQGLTADEQATLFFSKIPWREALHRDNSAPLFPLLLRGWISFVPITELGLRLLPLCLSILSLFLVLRFWRQPFVLGLFAINPLSVEFGSELRNSALFELTTILYVYLTMRLVENASSETLLMNERRPWFQLLASAIALCLSHYIGFFLVVASLLLLLRSVERIVTRIWIVSACVLSVLFMFWVNKNAIRGHSLRWMEVVFLENPVKIFTEPLYVLGSYSWALALLITATVIWGIRKRTPEAIWCGLTYLVYVSAQLTLGRAIGFRRYLVPLEVLSILVLSLFLNREFLRSVMRKWVIGVVIVICILQLKKIGEDVTISKSVWRELGHELCGRRSPTSIRLFGHESLRFYLPETCIDFGGACPEASEAPQVWLVEKYNIEKLKTYHEHCEVTLEWRQLAEYGADSKEPIMLLEGRKLAAPSF